MTDYIEPRNLCQLISLATASDGGFDVGRGRWRRDPSALIIHRCTVFRVGSDPVFDEVRYCPPRGVTALLDSLDARKRTLVITARAVDADEIDRRFYDAMDLGRRATEFVPPDTPVEVDYVTGRVTNYATIHGRYGKLEGVLSLEEAAASPTEGAA
jgi:hypothetical protein